MNIIAELSRDQRDSILVLIMIATVVVWGIWESLRVRRVMRLKENGALGFVHEALGIDVVAEKAREETEGEPQFQYEAALAHHAEQSQWLQTRCSWRRVKGIVRGQEIIGRVEDNVLILPNNTLAAVKADLREALTRTIAEWGPNSPYANYSIAFSGRDD